MEDEIRNKRNKEMAGDKDGNSEGRAQKHGGLEVLVDISTAVEKYGKKALPSQKEFLFWP